MQLLSSWQHFARQLLQEDPITAHLERIPTLETRHRPIIAHLAKIRQARTTLLGIHHQDTDRLARTLIPETRHTMKEERAAQ